MEPDRLIRLQSHDDGLNAWQMAHVAPPASLAGRIQGYCDYRERTGGFTTRRELPHADGVMIVNLGAPISITAGDGAELTLQAGEAFIAGAHLHPALSHSQGTQAGMHVFLPLTTLRHLLGVPMHQLADQVIRLDSLLGTEARNLGAQLCEATNRTARIALLDTTLGQILARPSPVGRQQAHALHRLRHRPDQDIGEIARDIGWSRKHLADRVRDAVGVGPRCFRRLLRFQALMEAVRTAGPHPHWAALAQDTGYCDQAHMIRDFREFSGMTPSAYLARSLPDGGGIVEY